MMICWPLAPYLPYCLLSFFFFNDTATTEIYTLSLHDALPISTLTSGCHDSTSPVTVGPVALRSEEHTSELQSLAYLVCRLLLEKKKIIHTNLEKETLKMLETTFRINRTMI